MFALRRSDTLQLAIVTGCYTMARAHVAVAIVAVLGLLVAVSDARFEPSDAFAGRSLAALDCSRIGHW